MTHTGTMSESDGTLTPSEPADCPCRACKANTVVYQIWESSCGGYEDFKYTCTTCKDVWWVEGIDS